ncbi:40S ribosomal protein S29-like [Bubalus kerabau]|uniref:40S ribosomal protein S29-like n=1 Tax=Bubalus carabanensis TaxID=3119969 RepID=UPI00244ECD65|nr:40S ribosomal protein S29-like [Bubalus carabanensis]
MGHQQLYWSHLREFSQGSRSCQVCSNYHDLIWKYGLNMCQRCFCQYDDIGFIKLDQAEDTHFGVSITICFKTLVTGVLANDFDTHYITTSISNSKYEIS